MTRFSSLFLGLTLILLASWQLPWWYNYLCVRSTGRAPFVLYSELSGEFILSGHDGQEMIYRDRTGHSYSREEVDSLLPTIYYRQLLSEGKLPDTLLGRAISPQQLHRESFVFRSSPASLHTPSVSLYPLLESASRRVDLEMPGDLFRVTSRGIEFIDIERNQPLVDKGELYTALFERKGFHFPAKMVAGNPTTRKEYDAGYLLIDSEGQLYHLKQIVGKPYLRLVDLPDRERAEVAFVIEDSSRRLLGLVATQQGRLYAIESPTYRCRRIAIPQWDPHRVHLTIVGNHLFTWTVHLSTPDDDDYYAIDAQSGDCLDSLHLDQERSSIPGLHFTSYLDRYVFPRLG